MAGGCEGVLLAGESSAVIFITAFSLAAALELLALLVGPSCLWSAPPPGGPEAFTGGKTGGGWCCW